MSDVSGIPNLGIPGLSGFNNQQSFIDPGPGLSAAQQQMAQNRSYFGDQAATQQAATVPQSQLYGPLGFGGQTAQSAALGAAYGRAVAPSSPAAVAASNGAPPPSSVFDTGTTPIPHLDSPPPGSFSPSPNYPGGRGLASIFDTGAPPVPYSPPPGSFSPSPNYSGGTGDTFASRFGAAPPVNASLQPAPPTALSAVQQFAGRGTDASPYNVPPSPPPSAAELGQGDTFASRFGAAPASDPNSFANRFAAGNYFQPGQPSEQTTDPYTNAQGQTFHPSPMPSGFSTPFSFDNPGGALGRGGYSGSPPASSIMNSSDEPPPVSSFGAMPETSLLQRLLGGRSPMSGASPTPPPLSGGDTLTAGDRGLTNPFNSGTAPIPFAGGSQGSLRDQLASTMTSPPLVNGGPFGTGGPGPAPTSPPASDLANSAYSRLQGLQRGGSMPGGDTTMGNTFDAASYGSPSNDYRTFQQQSFLPPWQAGIPQGRNSPDVVDAIKQTSGQIGVDPSALSAVINMESGFDPTNRTGQYRGLTQMGPQSFQDAGGTLGNMTFGQYSAAPAARQVGAYGDWFNSYGLPAKSSAVSISSQPPETQAAMLQGFQFAPNGRWPQDLLGGNVSSPTTTAPQAKALGNTSIGAMSDYYRNAMSRLPQQQIYSNY